MPKTPERRVEMTDPDAVERYAEIFRVEPARIAEVRRLMSGDLSDYHRIRSEAFSAVSSGLLLIAEAHQRCRVRRRGAHCQTCFGITIALSGLIHVERRDNAEPSRADAADA